jgi:hypothetical protein
MDVSSYFEDTHKNRRIMQRTLRELDVEVLALAMVGLSPENRDFVYGNLTKTAAEIVAGEVQEYESSASGGQVQAATEMLERILGKVVEQCTHIDPPPPVDVDVDVHVSTKREIVDTLVALAKLAKEQGLLALDKVDASSHELLAKGLQMVADGFDPAIVDPILERTKKTMLRDAEERLSMIIEGVESIQLGDHPRAIAARLEAFLSD